MSESSYKGFGFYPTTTSTITDTDAPRINLFNTNAPAPRNVTPGAVPFPVTVNDKFVTPISDSNVLPDNREAIIPKTLRSELSSGVPNIGKKNDVVGELFAAKSKRPKLSGSNNNISFNRNGKIGVTNTAIPDMQSVTNNNEPATNYYIPETKIMQTAKRILSTSTIHQIMFCKKERKSPMDNIVGVHGESIRRYCMADLPMLNYLLAISYKEPENPGNVMQARQVLSDWYVNGITIAEASGMSNNNDFTSPERLINVCCLGDYETFNIWGNELKLETPLFFIVKQCPFQESYRINRDGYTVVTNNNFTIKDKDDKNARPTSKPFQVIPYGNYQYSFPPYSQRVYTDEFGIERLGHVICLGKVRDPPAKSLDNTAILYRDVERIVGQPPLRIKFNPRG